MGRGGLPGMGTGHKGVGASSAGKIPDFYRSILTGIFTDFYREGYFYRAGKNTDGVKLP